MKSYESEAHSRLGETAAYREHEQKTKKKHFLLQSFLQERIYGIEPGTKFEDLPEDFECPLCGVGKDNFSEAE